MPQMNEPGCVVACQAVRPVRNAHSRPRHAMRAVRECVAQLGAVRLKASIVHEGNQTFTVSVVSGKAGLRGLVQAQGTARVEKTHEALRRTIRDGERAAYVIKTESYRPEASSTVRGLPLECRGRDW
jgi:hypothetical protein